MKRIQSVFLMLSIMIARGVWAQGDQILNLYENVAEDAGEANAPAALLQKHKF